MSGIVARLRGRPPGRVLLDQAFGAGWTGLGPDELGRRTVGIDGRVLPLAELFDLRGEAGGQIRFEGDLGGCDGLATGMAEGTITVEGSVGDDAGVGMSGGVLLIGGNAGANLGGAAPEARRGMSGGEIAVRGSAGERAGSRMRRGMIAIGGSTAGYAGEGMIAGSVVILGDAGPTPGLWSKRGSIVALGSIQIPPTYLYACTYRPDHLRVTLARLRDRYAMAVAARQIDGRYHRYCGDLADLGRGEILQWTAE